MSRGLWLLGVSFVLVYKVWRLQEVHILTALTGEVVPLNKTSTPGSDDRGWELREAGSDECLEDSGSGKLNLSYSTRSGGSWKRRVGRL